MNLLIVGAGAIGRGFLPWIFKDQSTAFYFIDNNPKLISLLKNQGHYTTFSIKDGKNYEALRVEVADAYTPQLFLNQAINIDFSAVFIAVGPNNIIDVAPLIKHIKSPIILCENNPNVMDKLKSFSGKENIYFAIPDVITSNTAPPELLQKDHLSLVTEQGILFIDNRIGQLEGNFELLPYETLIHKQWMAKLYLHNTPHCIAAYLGSIVGAEYIHQSMECPDIDRIVRGAMQEMLRVLKDQNEIAHDFLNWYAQKELSRFSCPLLFDPISRVAREPLRKLELNGRLLGAAQIGLASGFIPKNIMLGITAALLFYEVQSDSNLFLFMQKALPLSILLTHFLGLRSGEALEIYLKSHLPQLVTALKTIPKWSGKKNEMEI